MNGLISQAQISQRHVSRRPSRPASIAILAAALFATVVTGCGTKSNDAGSSPTPTSGSPAAPAPTGPSNPQAAQLLQDCSKATVALHSLHVKVEVTNLPSLPMESVDADVTSEQQGNAGAVGTAKVRLSPKSNPVTKLFLVKDKTMYTKDDAGGTYASVGPAEKIYDPGIILDKDKGLGAVIAKVQSAQMAGNDTINGVAVLKVTGAIAGSDIDPVVPQLGKDGGSLPITLYITDVSKASSAPPPTTSTGPSGPAGPAANLVRMVIYKDTGNVTITLSNWGQPVTVPNP
jgi:LppX_LprAFG lipoprotein